MAQNYQYAFGTLASWLTGEGGLSEGYGHFSYLGGDECRYTDRDDRQKCIKNVLQKEKAPIIAMLNLTKFFASEHGKQYKDSFDVKK